MVFVFVLPGAIIPQLSPTSLFRRVKCREIIENNGSMTSFERIARRFLDAWASYVCVRVSACVCMCLKTCGQRPTYAPTVVKEGMFVCACVCVCMRIPCMHADETRPVSV